MRVITNQNRQPRTLAHQLWRGHRFITYGKYNDYPQHCRRVIETSPTGIACRNIFASFLEGKGFQNEQFMEAVVNFKRQRVWQLLNQVALDYSTHAYWGVHVNYNLNLEPVSYTRIPPEYIRLGEADTYGFSPKIAISRDWLLDRRDLIETAQIERIDTFNPDPEAVARQIEACGGIQNYRGQVYVFWGNEQAYPIAPHHTVLKAMQTEAGIIEYKFSQVNDGFVANHAFIFPEAFESDEQAEAVKASLQRMIGPNGDKVAVIDGVGETGFDIKPLKQTENDAQFESTDAGIRSKIIRSYNQPAILHSEYRQGALGGTSEIENAFLLYNQTTLKHRRMLERCFRELFDVFARDLNPGGDYSIIPLTFQGADASNNPDPQGV